MSDDFVLESLASVLTLASPAVQSAIRSVDGWAVRFTGRHNQYRLNLVLLNALIRSESQEVRNGLAEQLRKLEGEAVLRELKKLDEIPDDVLEVLRQTFPNSKYLK